MSDRRGSEFDPARVPAALADAESSSAPGDDLDGEPTLLRRSEEPRPRELPAWARELLGTQLEHFELLDCIGEGGMGRVFRARDTRLDRLVALKVLNPEFASDADMRRRFEQEAKAAARLDSPFFARVYHVGVDKGVCFIAMELVEGRTLRQEIAEHGRLDPAFVLRVAAALAYGLHHAAHRGVVHRDVKPSNIVLDPDGVVKLIDMGLARDFLQAGGEVTRTNVTMGTLDYISPEQANDPRTVDVRSDIYSLGCTLYHALTGRPPFPEGTDLQKLLQHQSEKPRNPRDLAADVPEEFADLVMGMMAKRPIDRPQTPSELIHRLREVAGSLNVEMPDSAPALPPAPADSKWQQHLLWWGPVLLLLGGVVVYAMAPGERDPDPSWGRPTAATGTAAAEPKERQAKAVEPVRRAAVGPVVVVAENVDLATAVRDAPEGAVLQLAGEEYALPAVADGDALRGLLVTKNLALEPLSDHGRVRLRFLPTSVGMAAVKESLALVQVRSARLRLTRVWVEPGVRDRACVGVRVDQGELELRDCLFDRSVDAMAPAAAGATAIALNGGAVAALDCRFVAGDGLLRTGGAPASVALWNSLVGPYRRPFVFDAKTEAQMRHSAFLAGGEAVFTLNNPAAVSLNVEHCVFAAPPGSPPALLVDLPRNQAVSGNLWRGVGNLYGGGFVRQFSANGRPFLVEEGKMAGWGFADDAARSTPDWPWATPWETLASPTDDDEHWRPQLALKEGIAPPSADGLPAGVNPGSAPPPVADPPMGQARTSRAAPAGDAAKARGGAWVVDPAQESNEAAGVFASIDDAVRKVPEGKSTTLLLAGGGELHERGVKVVGKTVVLKTAERRVLRLAEAKDMEIGPGAMFEVGEGGRLELDGAQLDVLAGKADAAGAAFARCSPGGVVEASNATVRVSQHQGAQAMVFFRPTGTGANEGAAAPMLRLRHSDVRGAGPLLAAEPRQPWALDASSSRLGSEGPLLRLSGAGPRTAEPGSNAVKFRQCVAVLGSSLLQLEASPDALGEASATPVQFDVEGSILAATLGAAQAPLLEVTAPAGPRMGADWGGAIKWQGDWNVVAGFTTLLRTPEQDRSAGMATTAVRSLGYSEWISAYRLAPGRQHHQSARPPAAGSVWDVSLPRGKDWLKEFPALPASFAEEPGFQGLP